MSLADREILKRWVGERDVEAFQTIVQRYARMVYATCQRILGNAAEAEDVTQECFEALVQARKTREIKALAPWLHGMATKRSLMRIRAAGRRRDREAAYGAAQPVSVEPVWNDVYALVDEAIAELPDKFRRPVIDHFLRGQSHGAIARATGTPRRTVSKRIEVGLARIGDTLKQRGVSVPAATLSGMLATNLARADMLPETVGTALGKLSLAQSGNGATAATVPVISSLLTKSLLATALVAVVGTTFWVMAVGDRVEPTEAAQRAVVADTGADSTDVTLTAAPEPAPVERVASEPPLALAANTTVVSGGPALVTGRVVDTTGDPVAGAEVNARTKPMSFESTETDSEGRFVIEGLEPSDSLMLQALRRESGRKVIEGSRDAAISAPAGPFELTDAGVADLELVVHPAGSIQGRLVNGEGQPVSGIKVSATSTITDVHFPRGSETDRAGNFEIVACAADTYIILAHPPGVDMVSHDSALYELKLAPGEQVRGLELVYSPYVHLAGRVLDPDGNPVATANVMAAYQGNNIDTDAQGAFELQLYGGDPLGLVVRHPDYNQLRLTPGDDLEQLELVLQPRSVLRGRVVDAKKQTPIETFEIMHLSGRVIPVEFNRFVDRYASVEDGQGRFEIHPERPGYQTIGVRAPGYATKVRGIDPDTVNTPIEFALEPGQNLSGTVRNASGSAVSGASLFLGQLPYGYRLEEDEAEPVAQSSWRGRFSIDTAPPGEELLFAWHPDYAPAWKRVNASKQESVELVFPEGGVIEGILTLDGEPVTGNVNVFHTTPFTAGFSARSQADGHYRLKQVAPGRVSLTAGFHDSATKARVEWTLYADVRDGETTKADFDFPPSMGSTVAGRVTVGGETPDGGYITALFPSGVSLGASVDGDGYYSIPYLAGSALTLEIIASLGDRHLRAQREITVSPGTAATENFELHVGTNIVVWVAGVRTSETCQVSLYPGTLDQAPQSEDWVYLRPVATATLQSDTASTLEGVQQGHYTLVATAKPSVAANESDAVAATRSVLLPVHVSAGDDMALEVRLP